jgi:putative membrane protein
VSAQFLDEEARKAFKAAIETIEAKSGVEVVVAMRQKSSTYFHANLAVGAIVAFASLAAMLFADYPFSLTAILFDPFLAGAAAAGLVHWIPQAKRLLTRPVTRRRNVRAAARATFVDRGVHNTRDRSGLLVYISWLEQEITLVADSGIEAAWTLDEVDAASRELTRTMRHGGAAVAKALAALAGKLAITIPRRETDVNELPDAIDESEEAS